jgi:hypothetical protein
MKVLHKTDEKFKLFAMDAKESSYLDESRIELFESAVGVCQAGVLLRQQGDCSFLELLPQFLEIYVNLRTSTVNA